MHNRLLRQLSSKYKLLAPMTVTGDSMDLWLYYTNTSKYISATRRGNFILIQSFSQVSFEFFKFRFWRFEKSTGGRNLLFHACHLITTRLEFPHAEKTILWTRHPDEYNNTTDAGWRPDDVFIKLSVCLFEICPKIQFSWKKDFNNKRRRRRK